jgi:hypothetical protein
MTIHSRLKRLEEGRGKKDGIKLFMIGADHEFKTAEEAHAEADKPEYDHIATKIFIIDIPRPGEEDTIEAEGQE